jgi:hypothetical protein
MMIRCISNAETDIRNYFDGYESKLKYENHSEL